MDGHNIKTIGGRWRLLKNLGSGMMGRIWLALGEGGEKVALKLLDKSILTGREFILDMFKTEFSILRELSHPGINYVYDFGYDEDTGEYFFTNEYIEGEHFLDVTDGLSVDQIEDMFVQILRALEYLHCRKIIHGDIKSANVLVQENEGGPRQVKLIDFGLASLGTVDRVMGTPSYIAPEVILKKGPDGRADLYSLGVLVYSALTKFNPFKAPEMRESFNKQLNLIPEPPSSRNKNVPPYLDEIILKLLKKIPSERFPTAAHVIRAINSSGAKNYPVETRETFLGYLPQEGSLISRETELGIIRKICLDVKNSALEAPALICFEGEVGTGRKELLNEMKFFSQLNEMDVIELRSTEAVSLNRFNEKVEKLMADIATPTVLICNDFTAIATKKRAAQTIELLRELIGWIRTKKVLRYSKKIPHVIIAFATLPDELPLLSSVFGVEEGANELKVVKLQNLDFGGTLEYLKALTGEGELPEGFVGEIFKRTSGNPLFITELVKELISSGVLYDKYGRWNKEAIEDLGVNFDRLKVPETLTAMLKRVYENSSQEEKNILEVVAAWNRPVTVGEIIEIAGAEDTTPFLTSLIKSNVLNYDPIRTTYSFNNSILRRVIRDSIPDKTRASIHNLIKLYLEKNRPDAFAEICWHMSRGADENAAVDSLVKLGNYYLESGRANDAVPVFEEALILARKKEYRLDEILLHMGGSLVAARRYDEAIKIYNEKLGLRGAGTGITDEIITRQKLGVAYLRKNNLPEARKVFDDLARRLGSVEGETVLKLKNENYVARLCFLEGDLDKSIEIYERTKIAWANLTEEDKKKIRNNDLGHVYLQKEMLAEAEKELTLNITFFEATGARAELVRSYYAFAILHEKKGSQDAAVKFYEKAISIAKDLSDFEILLRAYNGLGNILSFKKDIEKALYWYERALDLALRTSDETSAIAITINLGKLRAKTANYEEAAGLFKSAISLFNKSGGRIGLGGEYIEGAYEELAKVYRFKGGPASEPKETTVDEKITPVKSDELSILDIGLKGKTEKEIDMDLKDYQYVLEINKYLSGEGDLDFVLKTILKYALELSGAHAGFVVLEEGSEELGIKASYNIDIDKSISEIGATIARRAISEDRIIETDDAAQDERFGSVQSVVLLGLKSVICVPIHSKKRAIGVLYMENRSCAAAFKGVSKELLSAFADQVGIAIENARLLAMHKESEGRLKEDLDKSFVQIEQLDSQVKQQSAELKRQFKFDRLVSSNSRMKDIFNVLGRVSDTDLSVCITGESGTGKELVARGIHYNSKRGDKPFVAVNCGAISPTLIESELFGYKAGAFTGAVRDRAGLFESAMSGTVFLDEIAELDPQLQVKLLRVIQEKEVMRLGDTKTTKCDVRVICATNKKLEDLLKNGGFREDLYYRISDVRISLPPLRERREDISLLIDQFVSDYCSQNGIKVRPKIDNGFLRAALEYSWPGNVRELENAVRVAVALAEKGVVRIQSLPENHVLRGVKGVGETSDIVQKETTIKIDEHNCYDPRMSWKEYESALIAGAYKLSKCNAKETANLLKISPATVYKKVSELGLKKRDAPLFDTPLKYDPSLSLEDYLVRIFKAAWEVSLKRPYPAAKLLKVSHGYFYKIMKSFG